jgi:putative endonuclease
MKHPATYIMASKRNGTLYTGVTSNLIQRAWQHRTNPTGFTAQYACKLLVWYELHEAMESAILREKQLKSGPRRAKLLLIESVNPDWHGLYPHIVP